MVPATLDFPHKAAMNRFNDISGATAREVLEFHCLTFSHSTRRYGHLLVLQVYLSRFCNEALDARV